MGCLPQIVFPNFFKYSVKAAGFKVSMISIPWNTEHYITQNNFYTTETKERYNTDDAPCDQESVLTGRSHPSYGRNKCNGSDDPNDRSQKRLQRDSGGRPNNARRYDHTWPLSRGSMTPPTPAQW